MMQDGILKNSVQGVHPVKHELCVVEIYRNDVKPDLPEILFLNHAQSP
jgi:hypothetical protein